MSVFRSAGQWVRGQITVRTYIIALVGIAIVGMMAMDTWHGRRSGVPSQAETVPSGMSLCAAAEPLARDWEKSLRDDPRYSDVRVAIMDEAVTESDEPANPYYGRVLMYGTWTFEGNRQRLQQQVRYKWSAGSQRWMLDMMPEILGSQ